MLQKIRGRLRRGLKQWIRRIDPPYPYRKSNDVTQSIFIHIPKNAGTSLLAAIGAPQRGRLHVDYSHFKKADPERFEKYYKFAVVRDPMERISSIYRYLSTGGNQDADDIAIKCLLEAQSSNLDEFVMDFLNPSRISCWNMLRPQSYFICDRMGNVCVDFVLKLERLEEDYRVLKSHIPTLPASLQKLNRSQRGETESVYSDAVRKRIKELYSVDYELFYSGQILDE